MDALALVCTLYADGPRSLRRLREGGCGDLGQLGELRAGRVAGLLGWRESDARRLLREARALGDRLAGGDLEREERHQPMLDDRAAAAPELEPAAVPAATAVALEEPVLAHAAAPTARPRPGGERALVDDVVARWRDADHDSRRELARVAGTPNATPLVIEDEPEPAAAPAPPALVAGQLDGLTSQVLAVLAAAGGGTLPGLAGADPTALAVAGGLSFSLVRRLQHQAAQLAR